MAVWVKTSFAFIPDGAIRAGYEADGHPLYIARSSINGVMTPGKCGPHLHGAHIPYDSDERKVHEYEVLVLPNRSHGFYEWQKARDGSVPTNAYQTDNEMYIGRAQYSGSLVPGKINTARCHRCAYGGKEVRQNEYEVLCPVI